MNILLKHRFIDSSDDVPVQPSSNRVELQIPRQVVGGWFFQTLHCWNSWWLRESDWETMFNIVQLIHIIYVYHKMGWFLQNEWNIQVRSGISNLNISFRWWDVFFKNESFPIRMDSIFELFRWKIDGEAIVAVRYTNSSPWPFSSLI